MSVPGSDLLSEIENDNPKLGILLRRYVWPAIQSRGRAGHVLATPPDAVGDVQLTPLDSLAAANNPKSAAYVGTNAAGGLVVAPTPGAGTVTAVTGTAPIGSTGGPTPDITVAKATVGGVGVVKPDGSTITITTDGTISAVAAPISNVHDESLTDGNANFIFASTLTRGGDIITVVGVPN